MSLIMEIKDALRAWREEHGLSQEAVARAINASLSGYTNWEAGRTSGPSPAVLRRLEAFKPGLVARIFEDEDGK